MEKLDTMMLADDLALSQDKILNGEQDFGAEAVYKVIDNLGVLNNPIKDYFDMTEEQYYETESDHKLTLIKMDSKLTDLHDRILTNHVDGFVDKDEINYSLCVFKQIHLFASKKQKKPAAYQPTQIIYALCAKAYAASPIDNTASLDNTSCKSLAAIA